MILTGAVYVLKIDTWFVRSYNSSAIIFCYLKKYLVLFFRKPIYSLTEILKDYFNTLF